MGRLQPATVQPRAARSQGFLLPLRLGLVAWRTGLAEACLLPAARPTEACRRGLPCHRHHPQMLAVG